MCHGEEGEHSLCWALFPKHIFSPSLHCAFFSIANIFATFDWGWPALPDDSLPMNFTTDLLQGIAGQQIALRLHKVVACQLHHETRASDCIHPHLIVLGDAYLRSQELR